MGLLHCRLVCAAPKRLARPDRAATASNKQLLTFSRIRLIAADDIVAIISPLEFAQHGRVRVFRARSKL